MDQIDSPEPDRDVRAIRRVADRRRTLAAQWKVYCDYCGYNPLLEDPGSSLLLESFFFAGASSVLGILADLESESGSSPAVRSFVLAHLAEECREMSRRIKICIDNDPDWPMRGQHGS